MNHSLQSFFQVVTWKWNLKWFSTFSNSCSLTSRLKGYHVIFFELLLFEESTPQATPWSGVFVGSSSPLVWNETNFLTYQRVVNTSNSCHTHFAQFHFLHWSIANNINKYFSNRDCGKTRSLYVKSFIISIICFFLMLKIIIRWSAETKRHLPLQTWACYIIYLRSSCF